MNDEFLQWLREQLDDDERAARAATPGPWHAQDGGVVAEDDEQWPVASTESGRDREDRVHIARHDPARVLAEVASKRAIVDEAEALWHSDVPLVSAAGWDILRQLGVPYADRFGYLDEWRP